MVPDGNMLTAIRQNIDKSLENLIEDWRKEYDLDSISPFLFASVKDFVLRKGKRIRPLLLILSYQGYSKKNRTLSDSIYRASTCIELLHNFMLVHDDIIDRSDLRRGKPTMHRLLKKAVKSNDPEKLGIDLGIIAGDIIYSLAIDAFLSFNESPERMDKALKYFIRTAAFTAMGEFVDTVNGVLPIRKISEKDVFLNYSLKTARYTFVCPLVVGALLSGATEKEIDLLSDLGLAIGQAFQIQDDIIGVFGTQRTIGKSVLSDIEESKKTLLVYHAFQHLKGKKRREFLYYFTKDKITYKDLRNIRTIFVNAGSLHYAFQHINQRMAKCEEILLQLKMKSEYKKLIKESFDQLFRETHQTAAAYQLTF
ncbi:MAG: polyprenyl synthetase family protein [Candidatus Omnitrophota bacterium]